MPAGMPVETAHDDIIGDGAGDDRKTAPLPEVLAPVAFAAMLELPPDLARRVPLARRTKSATGGISTTMCPWSRDRAPLMIVTPIPAQTCRMIAHPEGTHRHAAP